LDSLDPDNAIDEGDYTDIEDDIMNDDDDETDFLGDVRFFTDDDRDDEELLEARKNMMEFCGRFTKNLILGEPSGALVPSQPLDVDNTIDLVAGYEA